jgi:hypothetical protein
VAVLKSNIAACHIKLEEWKEAVVSATAALDGLERLDPQPKKDNKKGKGTEDNKSEVKEEKNDGAVVELDDDDEEAERALAALKLSDERKEQIRSLRAKSLMRRARANNEQGGWATLAAAEEGPLPPFIVSCISSFVIDYRAVLAMGNIPAADQKFVRTQLAVLPPRINAAKEKEMGEMMGKLKDVGAATCELWAGKRVEVLTAVDRQRLPQAVWTLDRHVPVPEGREDGRVQHVDGRQEELAGLKHCPYYIRRETRSVCELVGE